MFAVDSDGTAQDIGDRFVGAEAVASEIVRRLMPTELSGEMGEYIRAISKHGNYYWKTTLFGGACPLLLDVVARPDGSLYLELQDCNAAMIWRTTLRPAA